jgi:hypothetical protein
MPEIEIRPASNTDISLFAELDHSYQTDYVWQMDRVLNEGQMTIQFREIRLPRPMKVEYPYSCNQLSALWRQNPMILTAYMKGAPVGYVYLGKMICLKLVGSGGWQSTKKTGDRESEVD